jgi:hypothetical protein
MKIKCRDCFGRGWRWEAVYPNVAEGFARVDDPVMPVDIKEQKKICLVCCGKGWVQE